MSLSKWGLAWRKATNDCLACISLIEVLGEPEDASTALKDDVE